jgi:hypothetical protein
MYNAGRLAMSVARRLGLISFAAGAAVELAEDPAIARMRAGLNRISADPALSSLIVKTATQVGTAVAAAASGSIQTPFPCGTGCFPGAEGVDAMAGGFRVTSAKPANPPPGTACQACRVEALMDSDEPEGPAHEGPAHVPEAMSYFWLDATTAMPLCEQHRQQAIEAALSREGVDKPPSPPPGRAS